MRDDRERLRDIVEAIENIEKYANRGKKVFEQDELIQVWMIHHLQLIGEASAAMSERVMANYPERPWQDMSDFRNVLVHEYFRVDSEIVWNIVERELAKLKIKIKQIIAK